MDSALDVQKLVREHKRKQFLRTTGTYLFLIAGAVTMLAPFVWMVTVSLKNLGDVFSYQKSSDNKPIRQLNFQKLTYNKLLELKLV